MKYKEYYEFVKSYTHVFGDDRDQQHWLLGAADEFGEVLALYKKKLFKDIPKNKFVDEIGDVFFYLTMGLYHNNIDKPDGYTYTERDSVEDVIKQYYEYWIKKDLSGMYCCIFNLCELESIEVKECWNVNYAKLTERHKGEFNIDNNKHTAEEKDVIDNT
jgi:NTP pyrophosphatase (non-canonical NTP hydrolase)